VEVPSELMQYALTGSLSAGIAFGIIKTQLRNTMSYEAHREICAKERAETNKALNQLFDAQKDAHGMIKEIHGYLKAKNGGGL